MPGADVLDLLAAGKGVQHADDGVAAQSEQLGDAPALQVVHQQVRYQFLAHCVKSSISFFWISNLLSGFRPLLPNSVSARRYPPFPMESIHRSRGFFGPSALAIFQQQPQGISLFSVYYYHTKNSIFPLICQIASFHSLFNSCMGCAKKGRPVRGGTGGQVFCPVISLQEPSFRLCRSKKWLKIRPLRIIKSRKYSAAGGRYCSLFHIK